MSLITRGRTQFNSEALKNVDLEKLIEDYKQIESADNVKLAWEEVNGRYVPKKKTPKKRKTKED